MVSLFICLHKNTPIKSTYMRFKWNKGLLLFIQREEQNIIKDY